MTVPADAEPDDEAAEVAEVGAEEEVAALSPQEASAQAAPIVSADCNTMYLTVEVMRQPFALSGGNRVQRRDTPNMDPIKAHNCAKALE